MLFRNSHVNAPSCTPCRSSLLSGQYFWRTGRGAILQGAVWDSSIPAYPLLLKQAGYHIGKTFKVWSPGTPIDAPYGGGKYAYEKAGGRFWIISLFKVFLLQGLFMWIVSLPVQAGQVPGAPNGIGPLAIAGAVVWGIGLFFETVGDAQLARFKADPDNKGKVMDRGLWRYTRHPNYFGDFMIWWGLYLVALEGQGTWWSFVGPVLMSFLLLRVSGVAMLEKTITSRRPGYEEYIRRTSPFFPWPPRRSSTPHISPPGD